MVLASFSIVCVCDTDIAVCETKLNINVPCLKSKQKINQPRKKERKLLIPVIQSVSHSVSQLAKKKPSVIVI